MKEESILATAAISGITVLGSIYLLMGHNSVVFTLLVTTLAGIGGFMLQSPLKRTKK